MDFSVITGSMGAFGLEGRLRAAPRNMKKLELNSPEDLVHIGENLGLLNKDTIIGPHAFIHPLLDQRPIYNRLPLR